LPWTYYQTTDEAKATQRVNTSLVNWVDDQIVKGKSPTIDEMRHFSSQLMSGEQSKQTRDNPPQKFIKIMQNPQTGKSVGWNGTEWIPIN
jgi:hypothetical protein